MPAAACYCGSGRPVDRCHLMPRRERRHNRKALLALSEAHDTAMLFPWVRPRDDVVEAFARRVATEAGGPDIPQERIEEGVELIDSGERRRIVQELRGRYPDRWASLVSAAGDEGLTERAVVASAFLAAVLERLPLDRSKLEFLEAAPPPASPAGILVVLLDPHLVWDRDDAVVIGRAIPRGRGAMEFWSEAHALADRRVQERHLERVRELAERIESELPFVGLPRVSQLVADGVAQARDEDVAAGWVAGAMLAAYAHLVYTGKIERR